MSLHGILGPCTLFFCHTPSFTHRFVTHRFVTHHLSHTTFTHTHTIFHTKLCHIHHFLCRTPSFTYRFVTHNSSHTTCFTSRSSTTSFVSPSFPVPSTTFVAVAHYWKKLLVGLSGPLIKHIFSHTALHTTMFSAQNDRVTSKLAQGKR